MCQSKAEGGRRCAYHLEQGVTTGLTTYATATGLSPVEAREVYADLEREGLSQPDPTREEVDAFLEGQIFQVRHEATLTEKRRESIMARLKAAIGRILPNGATFHAWKNLIAESWSRVHRKAAAAFITGALAFSLGACGNAPSEHSPDTAQPVAAGASVTPGPQYDTTLNNGRVQITKSASTKFGAAEVAKADQVIENTIEHYGFDSDLTKSELGQNVDTLLAVRADMTPSAAADWTRAVNSYVQGDESASGTVYSLALYHPLGSGTQIAGAPVTMTKSGPGVVNREILSTVASTDAQGRLVMKVKSDADMRVEHQNTAKLWHIRRDTTYYMVQQGGSWKIDGWTSQFQLSNLRAE